MAILREGRIVQTGAPSALYDRPRTRFVADFLGKSNFLEGRIEEPDRGGFAYRVGRHRFAQASDRTPVRAGERILVSLRPEKITLTAGEPPSASNRVGAEIVSWSYFGTGLHFLVREPDLGELTVTRPSWRLGVLLETGVRVWLSWDPDAATVVLDDPER